MALLVIAVAAVAPSLTGFFRERNLREEASRLAALTEFGQSEAVANGLPMVLWVNPQEGYYGVRPETSYPVREKQSRQYRVHQDLEVQMEPNAPMSLQRQGEATLVMFNPDGTMDDAGPTGVLFRHIKSGSAMAVARTTNSVGFEILNEDEYAVRQREEQQTRDASIYLR